MFLEKHKCNSNFIGLTISDWNILLHLEIRNLMPGSESHLPISYPTWDVLPPVHFIFKWGGRDIKIKFAGEISTTRFHESSRNVIMARYTN